VIKDDQNKVEGNTKRVSFQDSAPPPVSLQKQGEEASVKDEYRKLLIELYKENQSFLNKAVFAISSIAIPYLFQAVPKAQDAFSVSCLGFSLIGFFAVISLQIWSLKCARNGCDNSLSYKESDKKKGQKLFFKAKKIDAWRDGLFLLALFSILVSLITPAKESMKMTDKLQNRIYTGDIINNSFTPPTKMVEQQGGSSSSGGSENKTEQKEGGSKEDKSE